MKQIESDFDGRRDQWKYRFRVLKRSGLVAMLEKRLKRPPKGGENWRGFEVVRLCELPAKAFTVNGKPVRTEARETMPSPENWGTDGFSYTTREAAEAKFNAMAA
jgi:hypothetical protein